METDKNKKPTRHKRKDLDKRDIERAVRNTMSNKQAARYLGISYPTWRKWAKYYTDDYGVSYFDKHKNIPGKGIPKMTLSKNRREPGIMDILEGRVDPLFYSVKKLKEQSIKEGVLKEECCRCGYNQRRPLDLKVPLIVNFKDGNKRRWLLDNIEFLCYNCYFLTIGDVFSKSQIEAMENYTALNKVTPIDFDLSRDHEQIVKQSINLENNYINKSDDVNGEKTPDFGLDLVAYIIPKK